MVEEEVRQVIADVTKNAATENCRGCEPVVEEYCMRELPKRSGQNDEQRRRHDQTKTIHRQVVVNSMQQEVKSDEYAVVR